MKLQRWLYPALGVFVLITIVVRMQATPTLVALGYDPVFGFLFSPYPILQATTILQLVGMGIAAIGGFIAIRWKRDR